MDIEVIAAWLIVISFASKILLKLLEEIIKDKTGKYPEGNDKHENH